jgi:hypothetical protein
MFTFGPASRAASASEDPFAANVILLCHFDGTNGDTTTTEVLGNPITLTDFDISSAQQRFGPTSLRNTGSSTSSGARITHAVGLNLGTGDFTIECFFRCSSAAVQTLFSFQSIGALTTIINARVQGASQMNAQIQTSFGSMFPSIPLNTWHHVALTREGTNGRFFVNGALAGSRASGVSGNLVHGYMVVGALIDNTGVSSQVCTGHIDEFRVTKGVARYTGAFTPPSAPFPNP